MKRKRGSRRLLARFDIPQGKYRPQPRNGISQLTERHFSRSHYRPLRLTTDCQPFPNVVDQGGQDHPPRLPILSRGFGRLQRMHDLRHFRIRIRFIHKLIQNLENLPDAHGCGAMVAVVGLLSQHMVEGLVDVVLAIKLRDGRLGGICFCIVPELCGGFLGLGPSRRSFGQ